MESIAYIGMGANIASPAGPPENTLACAARELARIGRIVCRSSLYSTDPVGFADQPRFLNAVVAVETNLGPLELLQSLLAIERTFGRDRLHAIPNGPRTLDLDLLLFGDREIHLSGLVVPHPRMHERLFVLVPLHEIAPELVVPLLHHSVKELLEEVLRAGSSAEKDAIIPFQSNLWTALPCPCGSLGANARHRENREP